MLMRKSSPALMIEERGVHRSDRAIAVIDRSARTPLPHLRLGEQAAQPHEVVRRRRERHLPIDQPLAAVSQLAQSTNRLPPAKHLFHQLPLLLADGIPGMPRGAVIDRTR